MKDGIREKPKWYQQCWNQVYDDGSPTDESSDDEKEPDWSREAVFDSTNESIQSQHQEGDLKDEDQISDNDNFTDYSSQDSLDTEPLTTTSDQSVGDVTNMLPSNIQNEHKEIYSDDLRGGQETDEFDSVDNSEYQISDDDSNEDLSDTDTSEQTDELDSIDNNRDHTIDDSDVMNESSQNFPAAAPNTPTSEYSTNIQNTYRISFNIQKKEKNVSREQLIDVATSSGISSNIQKKHNKIDQNEEQANGPIRVVHLSKLMPIPDELKGISSNKERTIGGRNFMNEYNQDLPDTASATIASRPWVDVKTAYSISSNVQESTKGVDAFDGGSDSKDQTIDLVEEFTNYLRANPHDIDAWELSFKGEVVSEGGSDSKDQMIDNRDDSFKNLSDASSHIPVFEQSADVAAAHRISLHKHKKIASELSTDVAAISRTLSNTQRKLQKTDQDEENTDDMLGVRETDEVGGIGNNENEIINSRDFMDELIQVLSDAPSTTPTSEAKTVSRVVFDIQKMCKKTASELSNDVATISRTLSNTQNKLQKIDQNEENIDNMLGVRETGEFGDIGNNENEIIDSRDFMDESIQGLSDAASTTPTTKAKTTSRVFFNTLKNKKIASEQSNEVATKRKVLSHEKEHNKLDHNEESFETLVQELTNYLKANPHDIDGCKESMKRLNVLDGGSDSKNQTIDNRDDSFENLFDASSHIPVIEQSAYVAAPNRISLHKHKHKKIASKQSTDDAAIRSTLSNTQNKLQKTDQNEENMDDMLGVRETGEFGGIGNNENEIIDSHDFMDDSIQDLCDAAPTTPTSEAETESRVFFDTQKKCNKIVNDHSIDMATASRIQFFKEKKRKIDQHEENTNDPLETRETCDNIGNDKERIIDCDNSNEDLSDAWTEYRKIVRRLLLDAGTPCRAALHSQKFNNKIAYEQLAGAATSSGMQFFKQNKHKIDQNEKITDDLLGARKTCDSISNNKEQIISDYDNSNEDFSDATAAPTPTSEQLVDVAITLSDTWIEYTKIATRLLYAAAACKIIPMKKRNDQNEENINFFKIAVRKFMQQLVECLFDSACPALASERSVHIGTTSGMSFITRKKCMEILGRHFVNVANARAIDEGFSDVAPSIPTEQLYDLLNTYRILSNIWKNCKEIDQNEVTANGCAKVACSKFEQKSVEGLPKIISPMLANEQAENVTTTSRVSFSAQKKHDKIDHNQENNACNKSMQQTKNFNRVGNNIIESPSATASPSPAREKSVDVTTASTSSYTHTNHKRIASEQSIGMTTTSRILSNAQNKLQKTEQNEENTDDMLGVGAADEFSGIGNNENETIDSHDFMDESIQGLRDAAPATPTTKAKTASRVLCKNIVSEHSVDVATASRISPHSQKYNKVTYEQSADVAGTSRIQFFKQKKRKIDQHEENINDPLETCDNIGNDKEQIIDCDNSNENLPDAAAAPTPASEQSVDAPITNKILSDAWAEYRKIVRRLLNAGTACRTALHSQKYNKIAYEQSADVAATSRIQFFNQKKRKIDQNEENINDPLGARRTCDGIGNNKEQIIDDYDNSNEDLSDAAAAPTPTREQSVYVAISGPWIEYTKIATRLLYTGVKCKIIRIQKISDKDEENINCFKISVRKFMQHIVACFSDTAFPVLAHERSVHIGPTSGISSITQKKCKEILRQHFVNVVNARETDEGLSDVAPSVPIEQLVDLLNTYKILMNIWENCKKIDQNEVTASDFAKRACSRFNQKLVEGPKIASPTLANEQAENVTTISRVLSRIQDHMKIVNEKFEDVTNPSRLSFSTQKKHDKIYQNEENDACNKSMQQTKNFNRVGNNIIEGPSATASPTPEREKSDDVATASTPSYVQKNNKTIASEQLIDMATTNRKSSTKHKKSKNRDQSEESTSNLLELRKTDEGLSETAPPILANKQSVASRTPSHAGDVATGGKILFNAINCMGNNTITTVPPVPARGKSDDVAIASTLSCAQKSCKRISSEQSIDVATTSGKSSKRHKKSKKRDQSEESIGDLLVVRKIDEVLSDIAPPALANEQSVRVASRISSHSQKIGYEQSCIQENKKIVNEQAQKKCENIDQTEENNVACSKLMQQTKNFNRMGNSIIIPAAPPRPIRRKSVDFPNASTSSCAQKSRKRISSEQSIDVATTSGKSSKKHKKSKKRDQSEESIGDLLVVRKTDEVLSDIAPPALANEQSIRVASRISSHSQKIGYEQSADVATTCISSCIQEHKKIVNEQTQKCENIDQTEENNVACNKLMQQTKNFNRMGNSIIIPAAPPRPIRRKSVDFPNASTSSCAQKNRERTASEQSIDEATTSKKSSKKRRRDENEEIKNELIRVACSRLGQERDEFDSIGNNVAAKLRALDGPQRFLAEKLIADILYRAQMNTLNQGAVLYYVP